MNPVAIYHFFFLRLFFFKDSLRRLTISRLGWQKLYYFKSIMNPVAIYHFFSFKSFFVFFFIIYWLSMIKWRFRGGAVESFFGAQQNGISAMLPECYQFALLGQLCLDVGFGYV